MICSAAKSVSRFPLIFALIVASSLSLSACSKKDQNPGESLIHTVPVQHDGRVKPFSAYTEKTVRLITSKSRFEKQSPTDLLLTLLSDPALLQSKKWIRVDYHPLKLSLSLPVEDKYFGFDQIQPKIQALTALASSAKQKRDADERPDKIEQKAELVLSRTAAVYSLLNQTSMATVPQDNQTWLPVTADHPINTAYRKLLSAWKSGDQSGVITAAEQWHQLSNSSVNSDQIKKNKMEDLYLRYHPFQKAWILYLFSALLFLGSSKNIRFKLACLLLAGAFFFHLAGLGLRVYILGRPPVSNMYESMIFMGFVLMFAGTIFSIIHRSRFLVQAGAIGAAAILIYADLLPIDGSLGTLVPVLRSNYWLTIHVLTIVASYGAYGLALVASHRHLWLDLKNTWSEAEKKKSGHLILRIIEVGTLLIAVGTILGGVWANESWGRFWGWDPKETWALITCLGYLVAIHLRYFNRIKEFGIAVCGILGFLLVLMTWYGVNFVLGRGLHSYGSGSGGMIWIIVYLILEAVFLAVVLYKATARKRVS